MVSSAWLAVTHLQYAVRPSRAVVHRDGLPCTDLLVIHSLPPVHALRVYLECDHHLLVYYIIRGEEGPVSGARGGLPLVIEEVENALVFGIHLQVQCGSKSGRRTGWDELCPLAGHF
jgi:hypothetical protein